MKISTQFVVAKYIPDLHRMEPRNIGVIVWGEGGLTAAQFLGENAHGIKHPSIVDKDSRYAYREWITYWRYHLNAISIRNDDGAVIPRESRDFLTALRNKSKEHFRLVDGGFLLDPIESTGMNELVGELFAKLVEKEPVRQKSASEAAELAATSKRLMVETGVTKRQDYHSNLPIPRQVHGVLREFTVDVGLGEIGNPSVVFQKVLLTSNQSVDSSAFMFETLLSDKRRPLRRENCAALINSAVKMQDSARAGMKMLEQMVEVIDVSGKHATNRIADIASRADTPQI